MSTAEERALAGRQVFIKAIAADVAKAAKDTRDRLEHLIDVGGAIAAELPDGTRIGTVKRSRTRKTATVTDMPALLAWVKANRPDEVVVQESVSQAFVEWAKTSAAAKHNGAVRGVPVIESTGEIVPGVELVEGSAAYTPEVAEGLAPVLQSRFAELVSKGYLALPSADQDEAAS